MISSSATTGGVLLNLKTSHRVLGVVKIHDAMTASSAILSTKNISYPLGAALKPNLMTPLGGTAYLRLESKNVNCYHGVAAVTPGLDNAK